MGLFAYVTLSVCQVNISNVRGPVSRSMIGRFIPIWNIYIEKSHPSLHWRLLWSREATLVRTRMTSSKITIRCLLDIFLHITKLRIACGEPSHMLYKRKWSWLLGSRPLWTCSQNVWKRDGMRNTVFCVGLAWYLRKNSYELQTEILLRSMVW